MRVNLGCGDDVRDGWVNIDARDLHGVIQCDIRNLDAALGDESVTEYNATAVLEHVGWREIDGVLSDLFRKAAHGCVLRFRVPCIWFLAEDYLSGAIDHYTFQRKVYGDQGYKENTHLCSWDERSLVDRVKQAGFRDVKVSRCGYNLDAEAVKA